MRLQSIKRTSVIGESGELDDPDYNDIWPTLRMRVASSVNAPRGAKPVRVTVIDSGTPDGDSPPAGTNRPQLGSATRGRNRDDDGHATLLGATIGGRHKRSRKNPSPRDPGAAPEVTIDAIKAFSAQGWPTPDGGASAIEQAAKTSKPPHVVVLAWDTGHASERLRNAILSLRETAVVVIAAGNWSLDNDQHPNWPANYGDICDQDMEHVITVMATDEHDERASFSSYGQHSVYIAAPGFVQVEATPSSSTLRTAGSLRDSFSAFRGTSAATAHVARLAALVWAKHPHFTPHDVKQHIRTKARPVDALKKLCVTGAIVDFEAALK